MQSNQHVTPLSSGAENAVEIKPPLDRVAAMAHKAVNSATDAVAPTANWLSAQGESLKNTQEKVVQDTRSFVSQHPLASLGVALLAGFLISRMTR